MVSIFDVLDEGATHAYELLLAGLCMCLYLAKPPEFFRTGLLEAGRRLGFLASSQDYCLEVRCPASCDHRFKSPGMSWVYDSGATFVCES